MVMLPPLHSSSEMIRTLICFVSGSKDVFIVNIDDAKLVGHLKQEIMKANPQTLPTVEEDALTLYKIDVKVDISGRGQYKEVIKEISRPNYGSRQRSFFNPSKH